PAVIVWLHRGNGRWCVLRAASPGGRIWTACGEWMPYGPVLINTTASSEFGCAACRAELTAASAGLDTELEDDALGPDTAAIRAALDTGYEDLLGDDRSAFDHLDDGREDDQL